MKKKMFFVVAITMMIMTAAEAVSLSPYKFYQKLVKKEHIGVVREYYTPDLTAEILENRGDDLIIERCIGKVVNKQKDGEIMGLEEPYNYISYKCVKGAKKGDIIMTLFVYQPGNPYVDDIVERFDYIIDRQ